MPNNKLKTYFWGNSALFILDAVTTYFFITYNLADERNPFFNLLIQSSGIGSAVLMSVIVRIAFIGLMGFTHNQKIMLNESQVCCRNKIDWRLAVWSGSIGIGIGVAALAILLYAAGVI